MRIIYENDHTPASGKYCNAIVDGGINGSLYLYDSQGTWIDIGINYIEGYSLDGGSA